MLIKAEQKFSRQTSTRLRLVAATVKKLSPAVAIEQLRFMDLKAAETVLLVMKQAVANATNNLGLSADALTIKEIVVGEGPQYKRFQPVSRGRAHSILKRSAHIRVVLESQEAGVVKPKQKVVMAKGTNEKAVVAQGAQQQGSSQIVPARTSAAVPFKQTAKSQTMVRTSSVRKTGER
ncbi:MAG: 50S ribosomal protein L22 [Patescibacteria group bacterium]